MAEFKKQDHEAYSTRTGERINPRNLGGGEPFIKGGVVGDSPQTMGTITIDLNKEPVIRGKGYNRKYGTTCRTELYGGGDKRILLVFHDSEVDDNDVTMEFTDEKIPMDSNFFTTVFEKYGFVKDEE